MTVFAARNLKQPTVANQRNTSCFPMAYREMMLAGHWTENSNDGDAAWANNVIATPADCAVSASIANRITAPSAPFTQAMADDGDFITLLASSDQNRGVYRIVNFIDASTVEVDPACAQPSGWVTESGISARIVGIDDNGLANGAWVLMDSPGALTQLQVRLYKQDGSWAYGYARPRGKSFSGVAAGGDTIGGAAPAMLLNIASAPFSPGMGGLTVTIAGAPTPGNNGTFTLTYVSPTQVSFVNAAGATEGIPGATYTVNGIANETDGIDFGEYYGNDCYFNGSFDGDVGVTVSFCDSDSIHVFGFGELSDADPQDYSPGYIYGFKDTGWVYDVFSWSTTVLCKMLDVNDSAIDAWTAYLKPYADDTTDQSLEENIARRLINGGSGVLRKPRIWLANVASVGAVPRGYLRGYRWTNRYFEPFRPMEGAGNWLHIGGGLVVPRNGPNDKLPLTP